MPLLSISDAVHCIRSRSALQPSPQCTASVLAVHCLHRERKGTLLQNTSSAQPWNANDRFEGLDWTHTHTYIYVRLGLCNGLYELDVLRPMMKLSSRGIGWLFTLLQELSSLCYLNYCLPDSIVSEQGCVLAVPPHG